MPRELNYLTVDKECQAIKRELEALKHTLIGRHLHLFSERGCGKPDNPSGIPRILVRFIAISAVPSLLSKCLRLNKAAAVKAMQSKGIHNDSHYPTKIDLGRSPARQRQFYRERQLTNVSEPFSEDFGWIVKPKIYSLTFLFFLSSERWL